MTKPGRPLLLSLLFAALVALLLAGSPVAAEPLGEKVDQEELELEDIKRQAKRRKHQIRSRISRYTAAAGEKYAENDPEAGLELLQRLKIDRLNPFEQAQVHRLQAYMHYGAGDYQAAIDSFRAVIELQIMPVKDEIALRLSIAQLYAALQEWPEVVTSLRDWFRYIPEPESKDYYLLAIAYYAQDDFEQAKTWGETAVDGSVAPKEKWLQLLAALYVREEDYANATPVFEELVMRFPKKAYWVQLALIYGARDDYVNSLAVQQIAYQQGLLTDGNELERLARSYLFENLPYPAAGVLEQGLESGAIEPEAEAYELLANAWIAAREFEKAVEPLTRAAEIAASGDLYIRLGQVNMQNEKWTKAASLIRKGLDKGGFDDKKLASAQLLLGICLYNAEDVVPARTAFRQARRHESMRKQADAWITHITKELEAAS